MSGVLCPGYEPAVILAGEKKSMEMSHGDYWFVVRKRHGEIEGITCGCNSSV
jgi:hypothetical protein